MAESITYVALTEEQLTAYLQQGAEKAVERFIDATQEPLVPKEKIKAVFEIKDDATFYKLRKRKGVEAAEMWGNCPVYRLSDFLKTP